MCVTLIWFHFILFSAPCYTLIVLSKLSTNLNVYKFGCFIGEPLAYMGVWQIDEYCEEFAGQPEDGKSTAILILKICKNCKSM